MVTKSMSTTIQLAPAPSHLTVQSLPEPGLYGHVSECTTEASESHPSIAVLYSLLDMLKAPNAAAFQSKTASEGQPFASWQVQI